MNSKKRDELKKIRCLASKNMSRESPLIKLSGKDGEWCASVNAEFWADPLDGNTLADHVPLALTLACLI